MRQWPAAIVGERIEQVMREHRCKVERSGGLAVAQGSPNSISAALKDLGLRTQGQNALVYPRAGRDGEQVGVYLVSGESDTWTIVISIGELTP